MDRGLDLREAIINKDTKLTKLLLEDNAYDSWAFRFACDEGLFDIVRLLLENKMHDPCKIQNAAIYFAYEKKFHKIVQLLWNDKRVRNTLENDNVELYNELIQKYLTIKINTF